MEVNQHRTWAEIDLGAIEHNYRVICEQAQAPVLCVVKADAYGHGAVQVAKRLEKMDAPYFAVATIPEGVELREAGIETPILILGYVDEKDMDTAVQYGITVPVYDRETAELISAAAERTGKPVTVHYKLDTGHDAARLPSWECEQTVQDIPCVLQAAGPDQRRAFSRILRLPMCPPARHTRNCSTSASRMCARVCKRPVLTCRCATVRTAAPSRPTRRCTAR